jgi:hypothetical protein
MQPNGEVKLLVNVEHNDLDYRQVHANNPVFDPPARPRLVCSIQVTENNGSTATASIPLAELLGMVNILVMESATNFR